jgi:hypothetical protein
MLLARKSRGRYNVRNVEILLVEIDMVRVEVDTWVLKG